MIKKTVIEPTTTLPKRSISDSLCSITNSSNENGGKKQTKNAAVPGAQQLNPETATRPNSADAARKKAKKVKKRSLGELNTAMNRYKQRVETYLFFNLTI